METICTSSDGYLTRYFAYVSGENVELAKAEVHVLAKLFSKDIKVTWNDRLAIIESAKDPSDFILGRAALTQKAGMILFESMSIENLINTQSFESWTDFIGPNDTFCVKTLCIKIDVETKVRLQIEKGLGANIKTATNAGVNLRNSSVQIMVILTENEIFVCYSMDSVLRSNLRKREPGRKPFFHPSMMNSTLARIMCNLAQIMPENIVLDPFCGAGGILCEASYIGSFVIGADLNWTLLTGAKRNLTEINQNYSILQADVRHIPIASVDSIVTDPPYGRSSSTRGLQSVKLVESLIDRIDLMIRLHGERVCLCGSTEMNLPLLVQDKGFHLGQDFKIRVHSGLVRELVTIKT